jgi:hypothetical protein
MEDAPIPNPNRERITQKTKRHIRLQIYLPLALGVVVLAGLGIWVVLAEFGTFSVWGDVGLVLIIIPTFVIGLLVFAALIAVTYGLFRLIAALPEPSDRVFLAFERVGEMASQGADVALRPVIAVRKAGAALKVAWNALISLF